MNATPELLDAHTQKHEWAIFDGEREQHRLPAAGMNVPASEDPASPWRSWISEERDAGSNLVRQRASNGTPDDPGATITSAVGRGIGR